MYEMFCSNHIINNNHMYLEPDINCIDIEWVLRKTVIVKTQGQTGGVS